MPTRSTTSTGILIGVLGFVSAYALGIAQEARAIDASRGIRELKTAILCIDLRDQPGGEFSRKTLSALSDRGIPVSDSTRRHLLAGDEFFRGIGTIEVARDHITPNRRCIEKE